MLTLERGRQVAFGLSVREVIKMATQSVRCAPGPVRWQKLCGQLWVVERGPAKGVDEESPDHEALLRIEHGALADGAQRAIEAQHEGAVFRAHGIEVPAFARDRG